MFTYDRTGSRPFGDERFDAPVELDTRELARRWAAWFDLSGAEPSPIRSQHAVHLARMLTGEQNPLAPSWFGTVSVTSARYQVVAQARAFEYHCRKGADLPEQLRTPRWTALVRAADRWPRLSPVDSVVAAALLTQLGFHRELMALVGTLTPDPDPLRQQLAYEVSRAAYQLNRRSALHREVFGWLAREAVRPALRVLAALQLVSTGSRDADDRAAVASWLDVARRACADLDREDDWLAHLVTSRFHRAAALHELGARDLDRVLAHLDSAWRHDGLGHAAAQGDAVRVHYLNENRSLVLEAYLKLDARAGTSGAPPEAVELLRALDPVDPEPLYAIGDYLARRGDVEHAHDAFLTAAASGTVRGAMAAAAAADCADLLGRSDDADRARRLCLDLDPGAVIPARS